MVNFSKNEDCPASDELLAFQTGGLTEVEGTAVRSHLATCEFCTAEVDFYSHFPQSEDAFETAQMPKPLFDLAQALMSKIKDHSFFKKLMDENGDVSSAKPNGASSNDIGRKSAR